MAVSMICFPSFTLEHPTESAAVSRLTLMSGRARRLVNCSVEMGTP